MVVEQEDVEKTDVTEEDDPTHRGSSVGKLGNKTEMTQITS